MKTVNFSETIAASDLKGREQTSNSKICEYRRSQSFLDQRRLHTKLQTGFSQKLLYRSEPNFV